MSRYRLVHKQLALVQVIACYLGKQRLKCCQHPLLAVSPHGIGCLHDAHLDDQRLEYELSMERKASLLNPGAERPDLRLLVGCKP